MITKIAAGLMTIALLGACQTTTKKTTKRETLREHNRYASNNQSNLNEAAPPAEGPEDVAGLRPGDPNRNPALVPSPLLRANAIGNP